MCNAFLFESRQRAVTIAVGARRRCTPVTIFNVRRFYRAGYVLCLWLFFLFRFVCSPTSVPPRRRGLLRYRFWRRPAATTRPTDSADSTGPATNRYASDGHADNDNAARRPSECRILFSADGREQRKPLMDRGITPLFTV